MKLLSLVLSLLLPQSFALADLPAVVIPAAISTLTCEGEGQKLELEWNGSPYSITVKINGLEESRTGLQFSADYTNGTSTYSKKNVFSISLTEFDVKRTERFSKDVEMSSSNLHMTCLFTQGLKAQ